MCLETVSAEIDNPTTLIQSGWKHFDGLPGSPRFEQYKYKGSRDVPLDKWITAEGDKIDGWGGAKYKPGFHIYADETEKITKGKRRVYYRKVHARGRQDNSTVVVALEMYVPKDPDGWPPR